MISAAKCEQMKNLAALSFRFADRDEIIYDLKRNLFEIKYSSWFTDYHVLYDRNNGNAMVYIDGEHETGTEKARETLVEARKRFVNDLFWLNPICHISGDQTERLLIDEKNLGVRFYSGGFTPGDAYVFVPDDLYRIKEMKMWVSTIPIRGVTADFDNYTYYPQDVVIARNHDMLWLFDVELENIVLRTKYPSENEKDIFADLVKRRSKAE